MPGRRLASTQNQRQPLSKKKLQRGISNALTVAEQTLPHEPKFQKNRISYLEHNGNKRSRNSEVIVKNQYRPNLKRPRQDDSEIGSEGEWVSGRVHCGDDFNYDSENTTVESDSEGFLNSTIRGGLDDKTKTSHCSSDLNISIDSGLGNGVSLNNGSEESRNNSDLESEGFAAEAVDIAATLDQRDTESEEESGRYHHRLSWYEDRAYNDARENDSIYKSLSATDSDADEGMDKASRLKALREFVSSIDSVQRVAPVQMQQAEANETATPTEYGINTNKKLTIADLLPTIADSKLRRSLRSIAKEGQNSSRDGKIPQKLDVPLAKRQQERIDRAAAFDKSKEALNKWIEAITYNRRAEHLLFPLPDNALSAKDNKKLQPKITSNFPSNLEVTIQKILVENGMVVSGAVTEEDQIAAFEELATNRMSIEDVQARQIQLKKQRDLLFREEIKARRIKKIKSKAYRKVHRKERSTLAQHEHEGIEFAHGEDDENEQEKIHRLRAERRMGAKHRENKWAKEIRVSGRAAWDNDARGSVQEMVRREDELKRQILGQAIAWNGTGDENAEGAEIGSSNDDDGESSVEKMRGTLVSLKNDGTQKTSLSAMKFMQNAEAIQRARNLDDIQRLQMLLDQGTSMTRDSKDEKEAPGRRSYGQTSATQELQQQSQYKQKEKEMEEGDEHIRRHRARVQNQKVQGKIYHEDVGEIEEASRSSWTDIDRKFEVHTSIDERLKSEPRPKSNDNAWIAKTTRGSQMARHDTMCIDVELLSSGSQLSSSLQAQRSKPSVKRIKPTTSLMTFDDTDSDISGSFDNKPTGSSDINNIAQIEKAFASDAAPAITAFTAEKAALADEEAQQETAPDVLPGWGSWVGAGLSKKEQRHGKRSLQRTKFHLKAVGQSKKSGSGDDTRRKDKKLNKVILSEKKVPKNTKYLAEQIPHSFETKSQYERSLRMPVGLEWSTKEVFQEQTKPRVIVKGGVIAPMSKSSIS